MLFRQNKHERVLCSSSRLCFDLLATRIVIRRSFLPVEMCRRDGCGAEMLCGDGCGDASSVSLEASDLALMWLCPRASASALSGLNATRHPVHKAAKLAPASQTNSAREHSVCAIKPLKSVRGSPTRLSHHRDHRDNTRRITRLGKKPFPPE